MRRASALLVAAAAARPGRRPLTWAPTRAVGLEPQNPAHPGVHVAALEEAR